MDMYGWSFATITGYRRSRSSNGYYFAAILDTEAVEVEMKETVILNSNCYRSTGSNCSSCRNTE